MKGDEHPAYAVLGVRQHLLVIYSLLVTVCYTGVLHLSITIVNILLQLKVTGKQ